MRLYPVPANEPERLQGLSAMQIIGSAPEPAFDAVVSLACETFGTPIALVSLLTEDEQWFKAAQGLDMKSTARNIAFCNYVVASGHPQVATDASTDARFHDNPLVLGEPLLRFYAGVPLSVDPGLVVGTLCVLDLKARSFDDADVARLERMGELVVALLRNYRDRQTVARVARELHERNVTIEVQSQKLQRSKQLFDNTAVLTHSGAWEWDCKADVLTWTDGMYDIYERRRGAHVQWSEIEPQLPATMRNELGRPNASAEATCGAIFEGPLITDRGRKRWVRVTADSEIEGGIVVRWFGVTQDITDEKAVWDRMQLLAQCDPLTKLPNRSLFQERLREIDNSGRRQASGATLLVLDVDGFKHINDNSGHGVGDECIRQIAKRLKRVCGKAHFVARLGGDEFAVIITPESAHLVKDVAERLREAIRRPIRIRNMAFQLSTSIGIACADEDRSSSLLAKADLALYAAKALGGNKFEIFTPKMKEIADRRFNTVRSISAALDSNELELFYQPKLHLGTRRLVGFEALLRWRKRDGSIVTAGAFAEALSDPDLSLRIDNWVVETALLQAQRWAADGNAFGHIAVNLGARQFLDPDFGRKLLRRIADLSLDPNSIEVEITEGVLLDQKHGAVQEILQSFRAGGIKIALDDFGTGYASLTHLKIFPVDVLKIDRSFVQDFLTSQTSNAVLQSMLFLARQMGLNVVAEGIEDVTQLEYLRTLGCQFGQGYLFSKAIPAFEVARVWFSDRGADAAA